jgi:hypothetical protein
VKVSILLSLALASTAWGQVDIQQIVRASIENYQHDWREAMNWAWTQTDVTASEETASDKTEIEVSEISPLEGTPYERLIGKNGSPLTPEAQRRENRKYLKTLKERENESPSEHTARIRRYERERAFIGDIPDAYNFKLLGNETVDGRPAWVVQMTSRPEFVPSAPHASMLEHIEGKLWIDEEDVRWAKAEAHVIDTISIGWILARIGPGTRFGVHQIRVASGLWMPSRLTIAGIAHVLLVHARALNEQLTYSGYYEAGSTSAAKPPEAVR